MLAVASLSTLPLAAQVETSTVSGRVSNAATQSYLQGAQISVEGTAFQARTGREGRYELTVPPGQATLIVSYTGLESQRRSVDLAAGETINMDFNLESEVYSLEKYVVSGPREGSAAAITSQREAPNVKSVVSSDSFGNIPDGNIGDFLQQLPGITAVYVGADVRSVQIRGIDGALNSVTLDGQRLASSQSAQLGRTFEFEQASLNNIETIEVTKAPTPDMDADSIGGNVNIVTKSAFDHAQPRLTNYTVAGVYRPKYYTRSDNRLREPIDNVGPSLNFSHSAQLGADRQLGIVLTGTYHSQPGGDTAALFNYQPTLTEPYFVTTANAPRPAGAARTRLSGGMKMDYKLSDRTTLSFNSAFNWFHESNDTRTNQLTTTASIANFAPGYTSFFQEVLANANSSAQVTLSTDDKSGRTYLFAPTIRHRFEGWELDYGASLSNSRTYYEYRPGGGRYFDSRPKGLITYRLNNIGWTLDRRQNAKWPVITQTAGPDLYNLDSYGTLLLTQLDRIGEDEIRTLRLNVRKPIDRLPLPIELRTGVNLRRQERHTENNSRRYSFVGADGIQNTADDRLGQFLDTTPKWTDSDEGYRHPAWASPFAIARHQADNPGLWREDLAFALTSNRSNDRRIIETVTAAYAMAETRIGDLSLLGGVRMEQTKTEAEGPLQVNGVFTGREHREGDYRNYFPGLHLRYEPRRNFLARLSYSTGIGRPSFDALIPLDTVNETTRVVTLRNPGLKPQYSDNYDATVEYYFEPVGVVSASIFLKDVKDFQFTDASQLVPAGPNNGFDGLYEGFNISTTRNGGSARYSGFELAYQQQFTFLPGFWRGFGAYANYTYLKTEGNYGSATTTTQVAGFVPRTGNLAVTYLGHGLNVRVNAVWRGTFLAGFSANPALLLYQEPKLQINLKARYALSPKLSLFCDVENLNKSPITETYFATKDRPAQTRIVVAKIIVGVQGRF